MIAYILFYKLSYCATLVTWCSEYIAVHHHRGDPFISDEFINLNLYRRSGILVMRAYLCMLMASEGSEWLLLNLL